MRTVIIAIIAAVGAVALIAVYGMGTFNIATTVVDQRMENLAESVTTAASDLGLEGSDEVKVKEQWVDSTESPETTYSLPVKDGKLYILTNKTLTLEPYASVLYTFSLDSPEYPLRVYANLQLSESDGRTTLTLREENRSLNLATLTAQGTTASTFGEGGKEIPEYLIRPNEIDNPTFVVELHNARPTQEKATLTLAVSAD